MYKNHSDKLEKIKTGKLSLSENVAGFLKLINSNKDLNAFNFVFENDALNSAKLIEEKIKSGKIFNRVHIGKKEFKKLYEIFGKLTIGRKDKKWKENI